MLLLWWKLWWLKLLIILIILTKTKAQIEAPGFGLQAMSDLIFKYINKKIFYFQLK